MADRQNPTQVAQAITVIKQDAHGRETWRYNGVVLTQSEQCVVLEASFNRPDMDFHGMLLGQGDRFVETWYTDRWYNIFEIHAREDDQIRGWYCNIGYPAEINGIQISYKDLCLDLLVFPDGRQLILDQDEFEALDVPPDIRLEALAALEDLQLKYADPISK